MYQTMLAILAITLATMFVLQMNRQIADSQMQMIRTELGVQTTGVAVDRLDEIGVFAFDQATVNDTKISSSTQLSLWSSATDSYPADPGGVNDIDDFHGSVVDTFRVYGADTLYFTVSATVRYADETEVDSVVTGPTKAKKVTVRAYSLEIPKPDTITLSQSYICASRCDW